jgi:hypothetical protein
MRTIPTPVPTLIMPVIVPRRRANHLATVERSTTSVALTPMPMMTP